MSMRLHLSTSFLRLSLLLSLSLSLLLSLSLSAQSSQDASVELSASVQKNPSLITLHWVANAGATQYTVQRKPKNSANWGVVLGTLPGTATEFTDSTANVGTSYEYKVVRSAATYTGYGYINSGIEVPLVESRGNLILVVDQ